MKQKSMKAATNGFRTYAVAMNSKGEILSTDAHTWTTDRSETVSGVAAGVVVGSYPEMIYPVEPLATIGEAMAFLIMAKRAGLRPGPFAVSHPKEVEAWLEEAMQPARVPVFTAKP